MRAPSSASSSCSSSSSGALTAAPYPLDSGSALTVQPLAHGSGSREGDLLVVLGVAELLPNLLHVITVHSHLFPYMPRKAETERETKKDKDGERERQKKKRLRETEITT